MLGCCWAPSTSCSPSPSLPPPQHVALMPSLEGSWREPAKCPSCARGGSTAPTLPQHGSSGCELPAWLTPGQGMQLCPLRTPCPNPCTAWIFVSWDAIISESFGLWLQAPTASQAPALGGRIRSWRAAAFPKQMLRRPREAGTGLSLSKGFERWGGLTSLTSQACFQTNLL